MPNYNVKPMKHLMAVIGAAILFACSQTWATDLTINLTDPQFGLSKTTNRYVVLQAETLASSGGAILMPFRLTGTTDVSGSITFSNLFGSPIGGLYHITVPAPPQAGNFDVWVSATNLGTILASSNLIVLGSQTYPSGSWAWSAFASDQRYQLNGTTLSNTFYPLFSNPSNYIQQSTITNLVSGIANTNQYVAGANVTLTTNGAVVTIASGGSGAATNAILIQNGSGNGTTLTNSTLLGTVTATNLDVRYDPAGIAATISNILYGFLSSSTNLGNVTPTVVIGLGNNPNTNGLVGVSWNQNNGNGQWIYSASDSGYTNRSPGANFILQLVSGVWQVTVGGLKVATNIDGGTSPVGYYAGSGNNYAGNPVNGNIGWLGLNYQSPSANLSNFAMFSTNNFASQSQLNDASNAVRIASQPASLILTNLSNTGANTNQYLAGGNVTLTTNNGNQVTISVTGSGSATNAILIVNGVGTNTAITTPTLYGVVTSTNLDAKYDASGTASSEAQAATNDFGRKVAVVMTNGLNSISGSNFIVFDASGVKSTIYGVSGGGLNVNPANSLMAINGNLNAADISASGQFNGNAGGTTNAGAGFFPYDVNGRAHQLTNVSGIQVGQVNANGLNVYDLIGNRSYYIYAFGSNTIFNTWAGSINASTTNFLSGDWLFPGNTFSRTNYGAKIGLDVGITNASGLTIDQRSTNAAATVANTVSNALYTTLNTSITNSAAVTSNGVLATATNSFVQLTNGIATSLRAVANLNLGPMKFYSDTSTNVLGTFGNWDGAGTYVLFANGNWTNNSNPTYSAVQSGASVFLQSNGVSIASVPMSTLLSATGPTLMTQVAPGGPPGYMVIGSSNNWGGLQVRGGYFPDYIATNDLRAISLTNSGNIISGNISGALSGNGSQLWWPANTTVTPTNGVNGTQASNITVALANGLTTFGASYTYGATNTYWIDNLQGNDTNSGLSSYFPIKTITNLQTKPYFGNKLEFAYSPIAYFTASNQPLMLSNNILNGNGATISDVSNDTQTLGNIQICGAAYVQNLVAMEIGTNVGMGPPINITTIQPPVNGLPAFVPITIQNVTTIGYIDGVSGIGGTWSNEVKCLVAGCICYSGWDSIAFNATLVGLGTNSTVSIYGNVCDSSYYNFSTSIPGYSALAANGVTVRGIEIGSPVLASVDANTIMTHDPVSSSIQAGINVANATVLIGAGNSFITNNIYGTNNAPSTTQTGFIVIKNGGNAIISGHPFPDNEVKKIGTGVFTFIGDVGTNAAVPGGYNFIYSDGTNRFYFSVTNTPANGYTIRYTNGVAIWAP